MEPGEGWCMLLTMWERFDNMYGTMPTMETSSGLAANETHVYGLAAV